MTARAEVLLAHGAMIEAVPFLVPVVVACGAVLAIVLADRLRERRRTRAGQRGKAD